MTIDSITRSLDEFFAGEDRVLVIKGSWGVGKTYLWDNYIKKRIDNKNLTQLAYSYVSLFGKSSLADIRASIFQNAKPISPTENIEEAFNDTLNSSTPLHRLAPWFRDLPERTRGKTLWLGWITKLFRSTPYTYRYTELIASLEYALVKNYVVCFDDLERKGHTLAVREMMGLADELAQRKDCKVVLIFNDNSFSESKDKTEFENYREKVVDAEIAYAPTHTENLRCVIPSTNPLFARVERVVIALDIKNIRVLKKLNRLVELCWPELRGCDDLIITEFSNHATVLCWSYYMRGSALPFDFIKSRLEENSWASYFQDKEVKMSENEKRYRDIASAVDLSPSIFDKHIVHFLLHGYMDMAELRSDIAELSRKVDVRRAKRELNDAWMLYTETFADNQAEIVAALRHVLENDPDKISMGDFSGALHMLTDFNEDVTHLLDAYVQTNSDKLATMDYRDTLLHRMVTFKPLLEKIKEIQADRINLDIDQVTMKIAEHSGWNPEEVEFLASLSVEDLCTWIRSNPSDLSKKIRSGLFVFKNLLGGSEEDSKRYAQIFELTKAAIIQLGKESPLNKKRAKHLYGIEEES